MGPSRASAIQNSSPLFALVLAWVFLGQALGLRDLLLMAGVVYGLYLTGRSGRAGSEGTGSRGRPVSAPADSDTRTDNVATLRPLALPASEVVVGLVAAAAYAIGNVIRAGAVHRWDEPVVGALAGAATGTIVYFVLHISPRRLVSQLRGAQRSGLILWVFSGAVTICGQAAMIGATAHIPVAVSAATPVVIIPVSIIFLGNRERVTARAGVGAALILVGVVALLLR